MTTLSNILIKSLVILTVLAFLVITVIPGVTAGNPIPTLGVKEPAEKAPSADGFIQRWIILDPLSSGGDRQNAVQQAVKTTHFEGELTMVPSDGVKVNANGKELTWHAVDTNEYNVNLYYLASQIGASANNAMFWAVAIINCPQEIPNVRLAIGSNSASVWWVNGKEVIGIYGDRQCIVDDGISKRLTLKKGINIVRAAIINSSGAADFCGRFIDNDGKPVKGYTVKLSEK